MRWRAVSFAAVAAVSAACAAVLDIPTGRFVVSDAGNPSNEASAGNACPAAIKVRMMMDLTGPTSEVSEYFWGMYDLAREINDTGGVSGCMLEVEARDTSYNATKAQQIYDEWKARPDWPDVAAILGWGTPDTLQIAPQLKDSQKPDISASYNGSLATPSSVDLRVDVPELSPTFEYQVFPTDMKSDGYPYNFFAGTDYSTSARTAMFHVKQLGGSRVGFFHCSNSFCTGPIAAAHTYADQLGLKLGRDLILELTGTQDDFNTAVLQYFQQELAHKGQEAGYSPVDWIWGGNTSNTSVYMAKAVAYAMSVIGPASYTNAQGAPIQVQLIINIQGMDENTFGRCATVADGGQASNPCVDKMHAVFPFVVYGDVRAAEMAKLTAVHDKWRARDAANPPDWTTFGVPGGAPDGGTHSFQTVHYVQGYVSAMVLREAIARLVAKGQLVTGEAVKGALETFTDVSTGGLTAPISFKSDDHRPQSTVSIYKVGPTGGLVYEPPDRTIFLQQSWLGW